MLAVEWLRRQYRILGRASFSTDQTVKIAGASSVPTRLPIRLSMEEVAVLLFEGIVHGLRRTWPVALTAVPTDEQLEEFRASLRKNSEEMQEIHLVKRRIEATGFYSQLVNGLSVHKKRQLSRISQTREGDQSSDGTNSSACSIRQRRRALRELKKRQKMTEVCEHPNPDTGTSDQEERIEGDNNCLSNVSIEATRQVDATLNEEHLTLDHLLGQYSFGRQQPRYDLDEVCRPEDNWRSCIPQHLPRATPQSWVRTDEVNLVRLPEKVRSRGLYSGKFNLNSYIPVHFGRLLYVLLPRF
ncbi:unnamed protein product [Echinostoma caproni]|uniref:TSEN34 N-terminal domain-containing protein n=1 Tax=Echinostoma caproni TaxID=27848 RepID=A0A183B8G8_9TREM|nr:unnamed protein product [Echinostoma caproni]